eukprot:EC823796.1.p1 GENE.EC823796.1~~EC823796.1.p1  ORF type:complete len:147 (+),score=67.90 EC823796.1:32-472(+)
MSGGVNFSEDCKTAWSEMKKGTINWFLMKYDATKKDSIVFHEKGTGGFDEYITKFDADNIYYGALKVTGVDDESKRTKFVYTVWIGDKVSPLKRARVSTHKSGVEGFLNGVHCSFQFSSVEDFTKEMIIKKLNEVTGAHKPKSYEF